MLAIEQSFQWLQGRKLDLRILYIRMISQGASEINMSFMIDEEDADEAVRSLHATFFKDPDPAIFDVAARKAK